MLYNWHTAHSWSCSLIHAITLLQSLISIHKHGERSFIHLGKALNLPLLYPNSHVWASHPSLVLLQGWKPAAQRPGPLPGTESTNLLPIPRPPIRNAFKFMMCIIWCRSPKMILKVICLRCWRLDTLGKGRNALHLAFQAEQMLVALTSCDIQYVGSLTLGTPRLLTDKGQWSFDEDRSALSSLGNLYHINALYGKLGEETTVPVDHWRLLFLECYQKQICYWLFVPRQP